MKKCKWIYYNHALIPDAAPHEIIEIPKFDKKFWKNSEGYPLLARWISDFDCETKTQFWYIIRTGSYETIQLSKSTRKHIRQASKKSYVREIEDDEIEKVYSCYQAAYRRYEKADNFREFESVKAEFLNRKNKNMFYYGAFCIGTDVLIGFFICTYHYEYLEINMSKFDPEYMKLHPSDALHDYVLKHWMNKPEIKYISSGSRSLNHETNVQEYKINTFGFRKAYCKIHIQYRPCIYPIVKALYGVRHLLEKLDKNKFIHAVNTILKMEEIVRMQSVIK